MLTKYNPEKESVNRREVPFYQVTAGRGTLGLKKPALFYSFIHKLEKIKDRRRRKKKSQAPDIWGLIMIIEWIWRHDVQLETQTFKIN